MKQSSILVSVILVAAVLIAAYAVGLLVKQARTPEPEPQAPQVSQPNAAPAPDSLVVAPQTRPGRTEPTMEERAKIKEERMKQIAEANDLTEEQKAQRRDELRDRLVRRIRRNPNSEITDEEKTWIRQHWSELSARQRETFNRRLQGQVKQSGASDANVPLSDSPVSEPNASEEASDPNGTR